jgi:hypothetical protein
VPTPDALPLLEGVPDESRVVADFFDAFDWEGTALDPEAQSAEDFLNALD